MGLWPKGFDSQDIHVMTLPYRSYYRLHWQLPHFVQACLGCCLGLGFRDLGFRGAGRSI